MHSGLDTNPYSLRPACAAPFVELSRIICFTIAPTSHAMALALFSSVSSVANGSLNVAVLLSSTSKPQNQKSLAASTL